MGPVYFCSCSNCNCTATVLSVNPRAKAMVLPALSSTDNNKNTPSYSFSTISLLPADNSKYVWREETHRIRTLVEATSLDTEVKDALDLPVNVPQSQPNFIEVIVILALAASTAVGEKMLKLIKTLSKIRTTYYTARQNLSLLPSSDQPKLQLQQDG